MSDLQSETGYISKVLTSPKNAQWRGYVFQKDDNKAYSVTLSNQDLPADLRAELETLAVKDYVTFHCEPSQGKDKNGNPKTYYNIYGLERPAKPQDEPSNSKPSPAPPSKKLLDGMSRCNVTQVAGGIYQKLIAMGTLPDHTVLTQLCDALADWHRDNME